MIIFVIPTAGMIDIVSALIIQFILSLVGEHLELDPGDLGGVQGRLDILLQLHQRIRYLYIYTHIASIITYHTLIHTYIREILPHPAGLRLYLDLGGGDAAVVLAPGIDPLLQSLVRLPLVMLQPLRLQYLPLFRYDYSPLYTGSRLDQLIHNIPAPDRSRRATA